MGCTDCKALDEFKVMWEQSEAVLKAVGPVSEVSVNNAIRCRKCASDRLARDASERRGDA